MRIGVSERFSAAHSIPGHERCGRLHGHNFRVEVEIEGDVRENGMVMDFYDLKKHLREVLSEFDHRILNEIIDIPTSENICTEIFRKLKNKGLNVVRVRVYESEDKWAELTE
ncbi:6-carboxytetrahydropterin synthase QueD [Geoglobus acetivorans]|uniref:Queuosine biosynthesis protein QueD n=1 Tax=Geoglobus acetivorans TaxID=565033 RepID=A0A0A7GI96_GEOAI|nr:Queuosine biosynthesis protein QueD [Geoglobus acetivorans]